MFCVNETVWKADGGAELIRLSAVNPSGSYLVVPAACDTKKLRELGEAIADALAKANRE